MARVRSKDTSVELIVRQLVFALGYRYRLHVKSLPGCPDLVFRSRRKVIFVHGCFWHRHAAKSCKLARLPKSRVEFWMPKLEQNRKRDRRVMSELVRNGWQVLTIWECQLGDIDAVSTRIKAFLDTDEIY